MMREEQTPTAIQTNKLIKDDFIKYIQTNKPPVAYMYQRVSNISDIASPSTEAFIVKMTERMER